jgi:hypothetical protein
MRFLLRLLLSVALASYLFSHYGPWIRQKLPGAYSVGNKELLSRLPALADSPVHSQLGKSLNAPGFLPRRDLTPGAIDPRITQRNIGSTICQRGYAATVRPPFAFTNAMKHRLMRAYGEMGSIHDYELDHLIPLELGGCPDCKTNLWPQPRNVFPGAREKDEVEDYLHHKVCSRAMSLVETQREIASDWYAVYKRIPRQGTTRRNEGQE